MAKTVGLPLGIAAKLILNGTINLKGLHIPTKKEIYEPVLKELEEHGIRFNEEKKKAMDFKVSDEDALKKLLDENEFPFTVMMKHGTMTIEYFAPQEVDTTNPA